jgi:hypothetical protein
MNLDRVGFWSRLFGGWHKALEAPSEARESSVPKSEGHTPTPEEPRTWWRR